MSAQEVAANFPEGLQVVKIDIERYPQLATRLRVQVGSFSSPPALTLPWCYGSLHQGLVPALKLILSVRQLCLARMMCSMQPTHLPAW